MQPSPTAEERAAMVLGCYGCFDPQSNGHDDECPAAWRRDVAAAISEAVAEENHQCYRAARVIVSDATMPDGAPDYYKNGWDDAIAEALKNIKARLTPPAQQPLGPDTNAPPFTGVAT